LLNSDNLAEVFREDAQAAPFRVFLAAAGIARLWCVSASDMLELLFTVLWPTFSIAFSSFLLFCAKQWCW